MKIVLIGAGSRCFGRGQICDLPLPPDPLLPELRRIAERHRPRVLAAQA